MLIETCFLLVPQNVFLMSELWCSHDGEIDSLGDEETRRWGDWKMGRLGYLVIGRWGD